MGHKTTRRTLAALCALPLAFLVFPALGDVAPEMSGTPRLAIGGYDTVAYHTVGKPFQASWNIRWYGTTPAGSSPARKISTSSPKIPKYAAKYDGHCAMGVAYEDGHKDTVDPKLSQLWMASCI